MITEAREPYTREYREDIPMNQEKSMEAHTSAAEASTPPVRMGGLL